MTKKPIAVIPDEIFGVDFSGAVDAGKHIWLCRATISKTGNLLIRAFQSAGELPGSRAQRDTCLPALRKFILKHPNAAFGFDFSFGLPGILFPETLWEDFLGSFPQRFPSAEHFRQTCCRAGQELRRKTDVHSRTPFSPYNLRIYRQTFYGLRDVLYPLIKNQTACILPMQTPLPGKPWLMEVCPASLLKTEKIYFPYKGPGRDRYENRNRILKHLQRCFPFNFSEPDMIQIISADKSGDMLDGLLAALIVFKTFRNPERLIPDWEPEFLKEGFVYY